MAKIAGSFQGRTRNSSAGGEKRHWSTIRLSDIFFLLIGGLTVVPFTYNMGTSLSSPHVQRSGPALISSRVTAPPIRNKLEFVHVPKTGGTAVEKAAADAGVTWGSCHYIKWRQNKQCQSPDFAGFRPTIVAPTENFCEELWETPPHWMHPNPFEKVDTFAVVRHPYDLLISQYYWKVSINPIKYAAIKDLPRTMNAYIWRYLKKKVLKGGTGKSSCKGHGLLQHYYIFDHTTLGQPKKQQPRQMITHVIKYENLMEEFPALMQRYNLTHIQLPQKESHSSNRLTRKDLTPKVKQLIHETVAKDFELFNYEMDEL